MIDHTIDAGRFVSDEGFQKWVDSRLVFSFEKQAGEVEAKLYFDTNCPEAALEGVGAIVAEIAELTGLQVFEVLSRLTVHLLKGW